MKNGYDENNNYNKSDETQCATNYSFITNNNKWNVNTCNNMQLTMHNKYTNDDVHQRLRGAHRALSVHVERIVSHCDDTAHFIWLKF